MQIDPRVRVNSIGFRPESPKQATVAEATDDPFRIVRIADGAEVFRGKLGPEQQTAAKDTDERVRVADFSAFKEPGRYQLEIAGVGRSAPFAIGAEVWNSSFLTAARGLYLWRCGTAVRGTWQGHTFQHGPCHLEDGWLDHVGGGHTRRPSVGGWHDAGDYNKYVVNAGVSVGLLLKAWEQFRPRIERVALDLPETGNGVPDLLNELRWELEWLFTMQLEDGRVYHKLSATKFSYWGPPDKDRDERYFAGWSSTATADFAAMMAMAARHFREFDRVFAERCLAAARLSWRYLSAHPEHVDPEQSVFETGAYTAPDKTHRLWAAAELWRTTGERAFLQEFERRAAGEEFTFLGPTWGDVRDLALGTYLEAESSKEGRDPALVARLRTQLLAQAGRIVATADAHAYGRPVGGDRWFWGVNGSVAGQAYLLHLADGVQADPRYRATAAQALSFLFGRNFHARSYVTGLGHRPPAHPHDRRGEPAWPGYLVGGGEKSGRGWVDESGDYRQNEIALNWNAALIYALAAFVEP
ncbi:MAG TPA: glycoside hydrolase family 9 protein [Opitutaceae bacterium]